MNIKNLLCSLCFLFLGFGIIDAQEDIKYQVPSAEILALADYQRPPGVITDSESKYLIFTYRPTYKTLEDLNQEEMRLGGLRVNPKLRVSSQTTYISNLVIRKTGEKNDMKVNGLPMNPKIANMTMSPNEKYFAFTHSTDSGLELYILDIFKANAKKITTPKLNACTGNPISWLADNKTLLIKCVSKNTEPLIDPKKDLPKGPTVSNTDGSVSQNRTFQDLLKNKTDEQNFVNLVSSELKLVSIEGKLTNFKESDLHLSEAVSPDGNYILITTVQKPFSYLVPVSRFPLKSMVYNLKGKEVATVNDVPLTEVMPKGFMAVRKGKRNMTWRPDRPASLYFVEAQDEGDPSKKVDFRDNIYSWDAPFNIPPKVILKTPQRFSGIMWGNDTFAIAFDQWYDTRNTKTYLFNPANPSVSPKILSDRNMQDVYSNPGNIETMKNQWGRYIVAIYDNNFYYIGDGFTQKGQFPFIDQCDIQSLKKTRIYESAYKDKKESLMSFINFKKGEVLITLESPVEFPNYYVRNIKTNAITSQLTFIENPFKSLLNVKKEVVHYKRKDNTDLSGTLYLPAGYNGKSKLPLLIWAYPQEFKDKNSASQNTQNPNEFTFPNYGSFVYWVTKGYAVLDDAAFPIIGEGDTEPNDNFIQQLVDNGEAAIRYLDSLGFINKNKVAVGGHSYGAFMTANLLTHSKLFTCGIARSGAYNRTLTPFGFQSEQRNYWEVPDVYNQMSPFMNAGKMKTPMLLVHGEADNNPGTFTLQTERYFQALKGLGAPARMVILPKESHGYAARENIFHLLWEQDTFLEKYMK